MSFPPTADTLLRRPDGLVVQQIWSVNLARWNRTQNESCAADVANHGGFICPVDLATQSTHMNIDKVRFRNEFVVPYVFEEGCARQQLVDPLHHVLEQMELARQQIDRPVAPLRGPIDEIEFQWSHAQYRFIRLGLRVGIRREIMKLIHRSLPVSVATVDFARVRPTHSWLRHLTPARGIAPLLPSLVSLPKWLGASIPWFSRAADCLGNSRKLDQRASA